MSKKEIQLSNLDQQDESQLMSAIKDIMMENSSHNIEAYDHKFWKWKYRTLPNQQSHVSVGRDENKQILSYYHSVCFLGKYNGQKIPYASIQDVAVSNQLRGQGFFAKISAFANKQIDDDQIKISYVFPNHRSIHTYLKYDKYTFVNDLKAYILPLNIAQLINAKVNLRGVEKIFGKTFDLFWNMLSIFSLLPRKFKIERQDSITESMIEVFEKYSHLFEYGLIKDKAYLDWRFIQKPYQKNHIFTIADDKGNTKAVAILKEDEIKGIPCLLLMDFAYTLDGGDKYFLKLLSNLRNNHQKYFGGKIGLIFTTLNAPIESKFLRIGFLRIPQKINPRPLNLLIRCNVNDPELYKKEKWNVTLCDWDVF